MTRHAPRAARAPGKVPPFLPKARNQRGGEAMTGHDEESVHSPERPAEDWTSELSNTIGCNWSQVHAGVGGGAENAPTGLL